MTSHGRVMTAYERARGAAAIAGDTEPTERVGLTCRTPASALARAGSTRTAAARTAAATRPPMIGPSGRS